jgi:hypothetical protein
LNKGKPEIYGTVFNWNEDGEPAWIFHEKFIADQIFHEISRPFCEVEIPEEVDKIRERVGFPSFQEPLQKVREAIRSEGGGPPSDFRAYKKTARAWAISIGWR